MVLEIIKYTDGKLRLKNVNVIKENPFLQNLIDDMFETLDFHKSSVGLSAPQVGHNLNLFIIKSPTFQEVFINPEIRLNGLSIQNKESCLSFPNMFFAVDRKEIVEIKYFDRNWEPKYRKFTDFISIIIQHEFDHLKGKLIID